MESGYITLSKKQQRRAEVLNRVLSGKITKDEAEALLELSRRQLSRVLNGYRIEGLPSLVHGNAGNVPANKTRPESVAAIVALAGDGGKYNGYNICHMHDLLADDQAITLGRSTLDRLLRENNIIGKPSPSKQVRRKRRERSSAEGMMLQIDGSLHDWLEGRGPKMTLVGAVDDATGKIVYAVLRPTEDLAGYLMMLRGIATTSGLPDSVYHDRHTILRSPKTPTIDDELAGIEPQSQFQRVLCELGITSIAAHSPQAKGRVERLWGTLQDRLVKEMRLEGIDSIEQANAFLPGYIHRYNKRFAQQPHNPHSAWVKLEPRTDLAYYFSAKESRVVRADHTVSWKGKTLEILPDSRNTCLAGKRVNVHVTPEAQLLLYDGKKRLAHRVIQPNARRQEVIPAKVAAEKTHLPDPAALARRRAWLHGKHAQAERDIMCEV
jgi:hypothetical protein